MSPTDPSKRMRAASAASRRRRADNLVLPWAEPEGVDLRAMHDRLEHVFSPTTAIKVRDLFAGRAAQLQALQQSVHRPGQHVVIYGERGVGKTSLVTVAALMIGTEDDPPLVLNDSVTGDDDFDSLWRQLLAQVSLAKREPGFGPQAHAVTLAQELGRGALTVDRVRTLLAAIGRGRRVVVIVDEFDRLRRGRAHAQFADLIKMLSDSADAVSLVIVGVAESIDTLISEHASIDRCLDQIRMPRMSPSELRDIATRGLRRVGMDIAADALDPIIALSRGLPHYTHLLTLTAAQNAIARQELRVTTLDVSPAIEAAIVRQQGTVASNYAKATASPRPDHLYGKVLIACALTPVDDRGYFAPGDVRTPMQQVAGHPYRVSAFVRHLHEFCTPERAHVLEIEGPARHHRFRFTNPLLQPYVLMRAIARNELTLADATSR